MMAMIMSLGLFVAGLLSEEFSRMVALLIFSLLFYTVGIIKIYKEESNERNERDRIK